MTSTTYNTLKYPFTSPFAKLPTTKPPTSILRSAIPKTFKSEVTHLGWTTIPKPVGTRIMMMPFIIGAPLPDFLRRYNYMVEGLTRHLSCTGQVGYLTIDEKNLSVGETHRRPGLHVDGVYRGQGGGWGGGGGWGYGGFLVLSSRQGCVAYNQTFEGEPGPEGECDHLRSQLKDGIMLKGSQIYLLNDLCVHESLPTKKAGPRTFVRLSLPNNCPWFDGYTKNPDGVKPTGPILGRRAFMDQ